MQFTMLNAGFSSIVFFAWILIAIISAISSAKKKRMAQEAQQNQPPQNPNWNRQQWNQPPMQNWQPQVSQWNPQQMRQQTPQFSEDNRMSEADYMAEEEFRRQREDFHVEMPNEVVNEYVPEEFGEGNFDAGKDSFYASAEMKRALQDEQDIAREKAYQRKTKDAFQTQPEAKKMRKLFEGRKSLKKAILLSEVLGEPKALQEK